MSDNNKSKIGIHMKPELINRVDAEYSLQGYNSRSSFVCAAAEFFIGYLHSQSETDYMNKTTLAFIENQVAKLDAKICRQMFRMCVEMSIAAHVTASAAEVDDETLKRLRKRCVKDVKTTIGNIQYDKIYAFQHSLFDGEDEVYNEDN